MGFRKTDVRATMVSTPRLDGRMVEDLIGDWLLKNM
jgi:hypothetical protein